jgi:translation initiation factor IF-1
VTKEVALEIDGTVSELLRNSTFRVTLENGHSVLATIAGKMCASFAFACWRAIA